MTEQELEQAFRSIVRNESKVRILDSKVRDMLTMHGGAKRYMLFLEK